jgi:hypothetical protein
MIRMFMANKYETNIILMMRFGFKLNKNCVGPCWREIKKR